MKIGEFQKNMENLHETKSTRAARLIIFHHYAVDDFTIVAKISLQAVLSRLPRESTHEQFP